MSSRAAKATSRETRSRAAESGAGTRKDVTSRLPGPSKQKAAKPSGKVRASLSVDGVPVTEFPVARTPQRNCAQFVAALLKPINPEKQILESKDSKLYGAPRQLEGGSPVNANLAVLAAQIYRRLLQIKRSCPQIVKRPERPKILTVTRALHHPTRKTRNVVDTKNKSGSTFKEEEDQLSEFRFKFILG